MVPGMAERERLANDMRRAEWLADAVLGPARVNGSRARPVAKAAHQPEREHRAWRLIATLALVVRHGISSMLARPAKRGKTLRETAPAQTR